MSELLDAITSLEASGSVFRGKMAAFDDGRLYCPWLEWVKISVPNAEPKGLLLMQDWGNQPETLSSAVASIGQAATQRHHPDRTLGNLFRTGWGDAINSGNWIVSNAIWGIRKEGSSKCGYLGDEVHKAAFPVWCKLITSLAHHEFRVLVAGEWAVFAKEFDNTEGRMGLRDYLLMWLKWVQTGRHGINAAALKTTIERVPEGAIVFSTRHPCLWNINTDWSKGPIT